MVGLWLVCRGLRQREDEREKWVDLSWLCCGWCCELRPVGCAVGGAMDDAMGCAVGLWWLCVGLWRLG